MKPKIKRYISLILAVLLIMGTLLSTGCGSATQSGTSSEPPSQNTVEDNEDENSDEIVEDDREEQVLEDEALIDEEGEYSSKEDVALYIHTYGHLPSNFITKKEAQALGWEGGGLDDYLKGAAIGGDKFGNYEQLLPEKNGRKYYECDIDTVGQKKRGAKRIIYSNDGLIYYTDDHYESFTLLYGEE